MYFISYLIHFSYVCSSTVDLLHAEAFVMVGIGLCLHSFILDSAQEEVVLFLILWLFVE